MVETTSKTPAVVAIAVAAAAVSSLAIFSMIRKNKRNSKVDNFQSQSIEASELEIEGNSQAQREVEKKRNLATKGMSKNAHPTRKTHWAPGGIPPGNFKTTRWLVTDLSAPIKDKSYSLEEDKYRLSISVGDRKVSLNLEELQSLGMKQFDKVDWHCVTGWSYLGMTLYGVPLQRLLSVLGEDMGGDWKCLFQVCADGYTCPVYREDALKDDVFLAIRDESGTLLSYEHGGPRLVFPALWGWKSAKYMTEIRLLDEYKQGFWEKLMCHDRGRIYDENGEYLSERWHPLAKRSGIHDFLTWMVNMYHHLFGPRVYGFTMYLGGLIVRTFTMSLRRYSNT